ncbi:MAG: class II glutamine amidotransferase [Oscillospiraceae bacterium]|nr:class II glutamine amidotransferase [Oscillospiraceae bacterium]
MCALYGWLNYKTVVPHKVLKKLTQALANAAEERGTDAAGISYVLDGQVKIFKRPKPAHRIKFNVPDGTIAVMGHTRMATQGNKKFNPNNHPFFGHADRDFAFAHNGVLYNDEKLRIEKHLPQTVIETDSYVAVQLIEQQKRLDFDTLAYMAETVRGNFTFTLLDENNSLYIIKGNNPMYLIHFESLGLYVYASTESIMKNALKNIGWQVFPYDRIKAVEGEIIKIDKKGFLSRSEFEMHNFTKFTSWCYEDDEEEYYYTMHEELLLDCCNCYGVDPDDVALLLDYGYTCDEIEDIIMDNTLFNEIVQSIKGEEDYSDFLIEI